MLHFFTSVYVWRNIWCAVLAFEGERKDATPWKFRNYDEVVDFKLMDWKKRSPHVETEKGDFEWVHTKRFFRESFFFLKMLELCWTQWSFPVLRSSFNVFLTSQYPPHPIQVKENVDFTLLTKSRKVRRFFFYWFLLLMAPKCFNHFLLTL